MNLSMIIYILSWIGCFSGLFLLPSCVVALIYREPEGFVYLFAAILYIGLGLLLTRRRPSSNRFTALDGYVTVALAWVPCPFTGAATFPIP